MLCKAYELGEAFLKKRWRFAISLSIFSEIQGKRGSEYSFRAFFSLHSSTSPSKVGTYHDFVALA
jgi:hypothetical protein